MAIPHYRRLLPIALVAVAIVAVVAALASGRRDSSAHIVPGEYSLEAAATAAQADVGEQFTVLVSVEQTGLSYQAVQWNLDYPEGLVSVVSMTKAAPAPPNCGSMNDNAVRVLLGCIDIFGPNLTYSGIAFEVVFQCDANGLIDLPLQEVNSTTFVKNGIDLQPIHAHDTSIICGPPPPTNTPTATDTPPPATFTPTNTVTNTATPTRTHTATPTIDLPPDQNQFRQVAIDPASEANASDLLASIDLAMEFEVGMGWNLVDAGAASVFGDDVLLYGLQRGSVAPRYDLNGDDFIDFSDMLVIANAFGGTGTSHVELEAIAASSAPDLNQLLANADASMETQIAGGWDVADVEAIDLDADPHVVYHLQRRDPIPNPDVNGDNLVDFSDALLVGQFFNTELDPLVPQPIPDGPDRFRHVTYDPAASPTLTDFLAMLDHEMELEIAAGWDPVGATYVDDFGPPVFVVALQKSLRGHRADLAEDGFIDFSDALAAIGEFGDPGINAFQFRRVDTTASASLAALLAEIDLQMEAQISIGWDVADSVEADAADEIVFSLALAEIPDAADINADGSIDFSDVLALVALFGTEF